MACNYSFKPYKHNTDKEFKGNVDYIIEQLLRSGRAIVTDGSTMRRFASTMKRYPIGEHLIFGKGVIIVHPDWHMEEGKNGRLKIVFTKNPRTGY